MERAIRFLVLNGFLFLQGNKNNWPEWSPQIKRSSPRNSSGQHERYQQTIDGGGKAFFGEIMDQGRVGHLVRLSVTPHPTHLQPPQPGLVWHGKDGGWGVVGIAS